MAQRAQERAAVRLAEQIAEEAVAYPDEDDGVVFNTGFEMGFIGRKPPVEAPGRCRLCAYPIEACCSPVLCHQCYEQLNAR